MSSCFYTYKVQLQSNNKISACTMCVIYCVPCFVLLSFVSQPMGYNILFTEYSRTFQLSIIYFFVYFVFKLWTIFSKYKRQCYIQYILVYYVTGTKCCYRCCRRRFQTWRNLLITLRISCYDRWNFLAASHLATPNHYVIVTIDVIYCVIHHYVRLHDNATPIEIKRRDDLYMHLKLLFDVISTILLNVNYNMWARIKLI